MKRSLIGMCSVVYLTACSGSPVAEMSQKSEVFQCTAFGHGPYDLSKAECVELVSRQALTNCNLNNKTSLVNYAGVPGSKTKLEGFSGTCTSVYDQKNKDCNESECVANETKDETR